MKEKNKRLEKLAPNHLGAAQRTSSPHSTGSQGENRSRDSLRERVSDKRALQRLSLFLNANDDQIDDMLQFLEDWQRQTGRSLFPFDGGTPPQQVNDALSHQANRILRERECLYQVMPEGLRNESYIRILMALFIDSVHNVRTSSKSACISSGCPITTALRYLDSLVEVGLIFRISSACDKRVTEIELTKEGLELVHKLLDQDRSAASR